MSRAGQGVLAGLTLGSLALGWAACWCEAGNTSPADADGFSLAVVDNDGGSDSGSDSDSDSGSDAQADIDIIKAVGSVETRRDGQWFTVQVGDVIQRFDSIRTGPDGKVVLDIGKQVTVKMESSSRLSVEKRSSTRLKMRLERGRISAKVKPQSGTTLQVGTLGSDAVATATEGEFSMLADGKGQMTVASLKGTVKVSARDKTVTVTAGTQSLVNPSLPPAPPSKIPPSLFLKVGKPRSLVQREKTATVRGKTAPGSVVYINNIQVRVGDSGEFSAQVPLREGSNTIVVQSKDVMGRRRSHKLPCITVDSKAPSANSKVTW